MVECLGLEVLAHPVAFDDVGAAARGPPVSRADSRGTAPIRRCAALPSGSTSTNSNCLDTTRRLPEESVRPSTTACCR